MIIRLIYSLFIILVAGKLILSNKFFNVDKYNAALRQSLYFAAGTVTISLYMLILSLFHIKFNIFSISLPFLIYFFFILPSLLIYFNNSKLKISDFKNIFKVNNYFFAIALLLLILMISSLTINNFMMPVLRADAFGNWVYKARVFFFDQTISFNTFRNNIFCNTADYPILLPLNLTWISICLNNWEDTVVRIFFSAQYLAFIIILYNFLKEHIDKTKAIIATLIILSIPTLLTNAEIAYADFTFSFYTLISVVFLLKWFNSLKDNNLCLSAFFIGASCWAKNDGIGLLIAMLFTICIYLMTGISKKKISISFAFYKIFQFIIISSAIFLPYKLTTIFYSINSHMIPASNIFYLIGANIDRLPMILNYFLYEIFLDTYRWLYFWIFLISLLLLHKRSFLNSNLIYILFFIFFSISIYILTYLIVPPIVFVFAETTVNRLLLGIAPTAGFVIFIAAFDNKLSKYNFQNKP